MKTHSIAFMIYGEPGSARNAVTEEKYRKLAAHFQEQGLKVTSILYHDSIAEDLAKELTRFEAILVWVNPIEQGNNRQILDSLLQDLSEKGCFISAHPDTILKMGTKEILYRIKDEEFGNDVKIYKTFEEFRKLFLSAFDTSRIRVLKQYRGNGGNGVFKINAVDLSNNRIGVTHATHGDREIMIPVDEFYNTFEPYFKSGSLLIDQAWNPNIINGMVRCYLSGNRVTGFGYQEINALYPVINGVFKKPSQRFYFSEDCGLFGDLKQIIENSWISRLQENTGIKDERLPVIWDADFFINDINTEETRKKYSLCEINVSCVSPFPDSSIPYITEEVIKRVKQ